MLYQVLQKAIIPKLVGRIYSSTRRGPFPLNVLTTLLSCWEQGALKHTEEGDVLVSGRVQEAYIPFFGPHHCCK